MSNQLNMNPDKRIKRLLRIKRSKLSNGKLKLGSESRFLSKQANKHKKIGDFFTPVWVYKWQFNKGNFFQRNITRKCSRFKMV